ncbi:MAG TPA: hypothetical protein VF634_11010 [Pyrinomonadaceae bacterium]
MRELPRRMAVAGSFVAVLSRQDISRRRQKSPAPEPARVAGEATARAIPRREEQ